MNTDKNNLTEFELEGYPLEDYPDVQNIEFCNEIYIAYAVCGKQCGNSEFIVDGSTQVCEYCGKSMFRTEVRKYKLVEEEQKVELQND